MRSADAPLLKDNDARRSLTELGVKRLEKFSGLYARAMIKRDVETVHDWRVASRRLQQILMTFASEGAGPAKKARAFLREIRRSLGALRNLDVMAKMADERSENAASDAARSAWTELKREIDNKRRAEDRQAERSLMSCDLGDFLARAKKCMDEGASRNEGAPDISAALTSRLKDWREALSAAENNQSPESLHALRIAGKRLRYVLELEAAVFEPAAEKLARSLAELQDKFGAWHDSHVLLQFAAGFLRRQEFLAEHPGRSRALLLEMERERRRAESEVSAGLAAAKELDGAWPQGELRQEP